LILSLFYPYIVFVETIADKKPTYDELAFQVEKLTLELMTLKRLIFGQKRERFVPVQQETQLNFLGVQPSAPQAEEQISYTRRKPQKTQMHHPVRRSIPAHLPRHDIVIEPEEDVTGMKMIGREISEELEIEPPKLYVNRYIRPKYARPKDEGVVIAPPPSRPVDKGIAGPGLIAYTLIGKYVDHLPLYRQVRQHRRQGVEIAESTINGWKQAGCELIMPLINRLRDKVFSSSYLMVDETPIRVLDPEVKGKTHRGYYWVYYDPLGGRVFFDYQRGRGRDGPQKHLKNFSGFLQTDGYSVYDEFALRESITGVGCMAHARRYFAEAQPVDPDRAEWMLLRMQQLYAVERLARENQLSHEERFEERRKTSAPVMKEIKAWLDMQVESVLPQSAVGQAVRYMLKQWPRLKNYLLDGRLEIDNNLVENAVRPIALGRKNYLFAGSHQGAEQAAAIYTLVANAKLQQVEPFAYLRDVIKRISDHPNKDIDQLLPKNWIDSNAVSASNL